MAKDVFNVFLRNYMNNLIVKNMYIWLKPLKFNVILENCLEYF